VRRLSVAIWQPWVSWAYSAGFYRNTEADIRAAVLELLDARFVVDDLIQLLTVRASE